MKNIVQLSTSGQLPSLFRRSLLGQLHRKEQNAIKPNLECLCQLTKGLSLQNHRHLATPNWSCLETVLEVLMLQVIQDRRTGELYEA